MAKRKSGRSDVWWLAVGHNQRTRMPTFAPPTARPVISLDMYRFGWHRTKACFVTGRRYGLSSPENIREIPCDQELAAAILRRCAYKNMVKRFFAKPYASDDDLDRFIVAEHMFGITLSKSFKGYGNKLVEAEACLYFYAPDGRLQCVSLHHGMTASFGRSLRGLKVADIKREM